MATIEINGESFEYGAINSKPKKRLTPMQKEKQCRKYLHSALRKSISKQISTAKRKLGCPPNCGKIYHLDHINATFCFIADTFLNLMEKKLGQPLTFIAERSSAAFIFQKFHKAVAEYALVTAKDNLTKASSQTREKLYGLSIEEYNKQLCRLTAAFEDLK